MSTDLDSIYERLDNCEYGIDYLREEIRELKVRIEGMLREMEAESGDTGR